MTAGRPKNDLIVLVADLNMESALTGILSRTESLGIRNLTKKIRRHPHRDPGCWKEGPEFLRTFVHQAEYALILFDREGCGQKNLTRIELENDVEKRLGENGWENRSAAVVIDPELEVWVWSDSPEVDKVLNWPNSPPHLRDWLKRKGFLPQGGSKPRQPKEALEKVLQEIGRPRSSSIYESLARQVSLERCVDQSFLKLKNILKNWFPEKKSNKKRIDQVR